LRNLASPGQGGAAHFLRESATTAEYFAASLKGTPLEQLATGLCIEQWANADLREAALVYADFSSGGKEKSDLDEMHAYTGLGNLLLERGNYQSAIQSFDEVIAKEPRDFKAFYNRGFAKRQLGDNHGAISDYTTVIEMSGASHESVALALFNRAVAKRQVGDNRGAISDYSALIEMEGVPDQDVVHALFNRGNAKHQLGDTSGAISDYTALIEMEDVSVRDIARALVNRGVNKGRLGDTQGAISDWSAVIDMVGVPNEQLARAFFSRWLTFHRQDKTLAAVEDLLNVIDLAVMTDDLMTHAANIAYGILWIREDYSGAKAVVAKLGGVLNSASKELARATALCFLNSIASPIMKDGWPAAWHVLAETSRPEVAEALSFLKPVCDVLEGKGRAILDGLPPEQREFAENVLKTFDAKLK
jgi:tetratricopeptide (TPR) repeat protein